MSNTLAGSFSTIRLQDCTASAETRPLGCRGLGSFNGFVASFRPPFCLPEQPCH
jgi:hypothetical protein